MCPGMLNAERVGMRSTSNSIIREIDASRRLVQIRKGTMDNKLEKDINDQLKIVKF